jgi:hypothetical protein
MKCTCRSLRFLVPLALLVAACSGQSPSPLEENTLSVQDELRVCPARHKIEFTKKTACSGDGSVEFCVPMLDSALQTRVKALAPSVTFVGSSGRAQCDSTTELLALLPTPSEECMANGRISNRSWQTLCQIASEPKIRRIVLTFFE